MDVKRINNTQMRLTVTKVVFESYPNFFINQIQAD